MQVKYKGIFTLNSSVSNIIGYAQKSQGSFSDKSLTLFHHIQKSSGIHSTSHLVGTAGFFCQGEEQPACETDHLAPSSAKVKSLQCHLNEWYLYNIRAANFKTPLYTV
jgi:hypothetical protein